MLSIFALLVVIGGDVGAPIRPLVAIWFLLICPGLAVAPLLRIGDAWDELGLVLATSVAIDLIVATAVTYAGAWSVPLIAGLLAVISLVGAGVQVRWSTNP